MSLVSLAMVGSLEVAVLGAGAVAFRRRGPLVGITVFLLVVAFVPIWVIVPTPIISPSLASATAGLLAMGLLIRGGGFRLTVVDLLVALLLVSATLPVLFRLAPFSALLTVLVIWCTAYAVGRLVLLHVDPGLLYALIAVIFGLVGFLALIEFVTGWHGLASWGPSNGARQAWGPIISRGGVDRAEGAFGHPIALGCTLAMTSVLTLQARLPSWARLALIALMVGGIGVTLSRGPLLCLAVGLPLALLFVPDKRVRQLRPAIAVMAVAGLVLFAPRVHDLFSKATVELTQSTEYRVDLTHLLKVVDVIGRSAAIQVTPEGTTYVGAFKSIDNQMLIFGLNFGWQLVGVVIALMCVGAFALVSRRGSVPGAAIVAQAPGLVTVALITQYNVFFWFVLGLAVGAEQLRSQKIKTAPLSHVATPRGLVGATQQR